MRRPDEGFRASATPTSPRAIPRCVALQNPRRRVRGITSRLSEQPAAAAVLQKGRRCSSPWTIPRGPGRQFFRHRLRHVPWGTVQHAPFRRRLVNLPSARRRAKPSQPRSRFGPASYTSARTLEPRPRFGRRRSILHSSPVISQGFRPEGAPRAVAPRYFDLFQTELFKNGPRKLASSAAAAHLGDRRLRNLSSLLVAKSRYRAARRSTTSEGAGEPVERLPQNRIRGGPKAIYLAATRFKDRARGASNTASGAEVPRVAAWR